MSTLAGQRLTHWNPQTTELLLLQAQRDLERPLRGLALPAFFPAGCSGGSESPPPPHILPPRPSAELLLGSFHACQLADIKDNNSLHVSTRVAALALRVSVYTLWLQHLQSIKPLVSFQIQPCWPEGSPFAHMTPLSLLWMSRPNPQAIGAGSVNTSAARDRKSLEDSRQAHRICIAALPLWITHASLFLVLGAKEECPFTV